MVRAVLQTAPHLGKRSTLFCLSLLSCKGHVQQDQEIVKDSFTTAAESNSKNYLYYSIRPLILKRVEGTHGFYNTLVFIILLLAGNRVSTYANVHVD